MARVSKARPARVEGKDEARGVVAVEAALREHRGRDNSRGKAPDKVLVERSAVAINAAGPAAVASVAIEAVNAAVIAAVALVAARAVPVALPVANVGRREMPGDRALAQRHQRADAAASLDRGGPKEAPKEDRRAEAMVVGVPAADTKARAVVAAVAASHGVATPTASPSSTKCVRKSPLQTGRSQRA